MFQIASPVISRLVRSCRSDTWPGRVPGRVHDAQAAADVDDLPVVQLLDDRHGPEGAEPLDQHGRSAGDVPVRR